MENPYTPAAYFLLSLRCSICFFVLAFFMSGCFQQNTYHKIRDGVVVSLSDSLGQHRMVRLQVINPHIIRVTATADENFGKDSSLMVTGSPASDISWELHQQGDSLILRTSALQATVSLHDGAVAFADSLGRPLLREKTHGRSFIPDTVEGTAAYRIRQVFQDSGRSALYGLGENQLGWTNLRGKDVTLAQHNSEAFVPFLVSTGHYAILWDNNSITHFGDPSPYLPLDSLLLYNREGEPGGLSVSYATGNDGQAMQRTENHINYSFIKDLKNLPAGFSMKASSEIRWEGSLAAPETGTYRFLLYSGGYIKIWINDTLCVNKWRQSWNPVETYWEFPMEKGKKYPIRIAWKPDGTESYLALQFKKPRAAATYKDISFASELGQSIDYYFIGAGPIDSLIHRYRQLTGRAPLMPLWAFGFWQSREHYSSQKEILDIVRTFREKHIPLDNIVQDWFYWEKDQWGSQEFDSSRYPHPAEMIRRLHEDYHTHFMISVWPKFYVGTAPFKTFWDHGWLYKKNVEDQQKDWVGYVSTFYDAFNPEARKAFWQLVNRKLFSLGVDAWWLDASEPDIYSNVSWDERKKLMDPTALGPSTQVFNAYPLVNEEAFYTGQRQVHPDQRVFILTRSAFGGSQRYAAATWSGDIGATWQDMKNQIATGISFSLSGIPYWTMDIGGFATERRYQHPAAADQAEWREQMTRWYQFGAFCPLFRAHGQSPYREIFEVAPEGSPAYASMLYYDRLRYRLLPYIYSLAGQVYRSGYTFMRGLAMDFPHDSKAREITDEFLLGPSLLVSPVYTYKATSRPVYLPGTHGWYNLYDGTYSAGGHTINAAAPYNRIPVMVRAGSILPFGPALEYTGQKPADTLHLYVYTGDNSTFSLYEDDGLTYDYEKGQYSVIPFSYQENSHTLRIGAREGSYSGMLPQRVITVKWVSPEAPATLDFKKPADTLVHYQGQPVSLSMPAP